MKKINNNDHLINERLAAFTDNVLKGNSEDNEDLSTTYPELRVLQKTVLRLKKTFPSDGPSDEAVQRMRENVIKQWENQGKKTKESFWVKILSLRQSPKKIWQSQRSRRRLQLAFYITAAFFLLFINSPALSKVASGQPAASGQSLVFSVAIVLSGFIVLVLWSYFRRD